VTYIFSALKPLTKTWRLRASQNRLLVHVEMLRYRSGGPVLDPEFGDKWHPKTDPGASAIIYGGIH